MIRLMDIRPATPDDVPAVLPMVAQTCQYHLQLDPAKYGFLPDPEQRYQRWLIARAADPRSVFLVAERQPPDAGRPAGLAGFLVATAESEIPIYRVKAYGFIHDLWVEPLYRNEGIGRRLVMHAIELFTRMDVDQVRCDVAVSNQPARRLFESCGLRPGTVEMLVELKPPPPSPQ